jgi:hypothetical protein
MSLRREAHATNRLTRALSGRGETAEREEAGAVSPAPGAGCRSIVSLAADFPYDPRVDGAFPPTC